MPAQKPSAALPRLRRRRCCVFAASPCGLMKAGFAAGHLFCSGSHVLQRVICFAASHLFCSGSYVLQRVICFAADHMFCSGSFVLQSKAGQSVFHGFTPSIPFPSAPSPPPPPPFSPIPPLVTSPALSMRPCSHALESKVPCLRRTPALPPPSPRSSSLSQQGFIAGHFLALGTSVCRSFHSFSTP